MRFAFFVTLLILIDQAIKIKIGSSLRLFESIPVIPKILHITYVQNRGGAFGLPIDSRILLGVGIAIILSLIFFYKFFYKEKKLILPIALILAGSLGNLFDRMVRGYVIDYIDFRVWPVFNLADILINIGVFVIVLKIVFEKKES